MNLQLQYIKAAAHPLGNRIDVQWFNPQPDRFKGVHVRRRQAAHPTSRKDGEPVANVENTPLFTLEPGFGDELDNRILSPALTARFLTRQPVLTMPAAVSVLEPGARWRISGKDQIYLVINNNNQLEVFGMSSLKDENLRAEVVYYYTLFPYKNVPSECVFHYHNRISAAATGPYDFAGQMYRMLPAIYHRYDTVLPMAPYPDEMPEQDKDRGQLRRFLDVPGSQLDQLYSLAAAVLDFHDVNRVDGKLLTLLAQWIDWDTDHNLEFSRQRSELRNAPALYKTIGTIPAIEAGIAKCLSGWDCLTKEFVHNVFLSNHPERMNLWLCERGVGGQWEESTEPFSLDFAYEGRPAAAEDDEGNPRLFYHTLRNGKWDIWTKTYKENRGWTPSQPLTGSASIDKHPSAALQGNKLWAAWNSFNRENQTWEIKYRERTGGQWSETRTFDNGIPGPGVQRKSPQLVVDTANRLWLFWLEKTEGNGSRWRLKYNRHNGTDWELSTPAEFSIEVTKDPHVEKDLFVLFQPQNPTNDNIWVFWARKRYIGNNGQRCWEIAFREKTGIEPIEGGWGPVQTLPREILPGDEGYNDCEPAAVIDADGEIELYWSSNRSGTWSVWYGKLADLTPGQADAARMLLDNPYSRRAPLPLLLDNRVSVVFRSNRSISYESDVYRSTRTTDFRYAGCTTVDPHNKAKIALYGEYEDFQTYTYDTGQNGGKPTEDDWYARDTAGLYMTPDTDDQQFIARNKEMLKGILERFLPLQTRTVFIINPPLYREYVYTDDFPIKEQFVDTHTTGVIEQYPGVSETYKDKVPGWIRVCSWSEESPDHHTVDLNTTPIDTRFRTWHIGLKGNIKEEKK